MASIRSRCFLILQWLGFVWMWRYTRRYRVNILMVHGVMDESVPSTWKPLRSQLSRRQLDRVLKLLSQHYNFISLDQAVDIVKGDAPPLKNCMVITFDDGYRNNLTQALPILERYGVPATFYVSTGHIEQRKPFWFDRLDYAIAHLPPGEHEACIAGEPITIVSDTRESMKSTYAALRQKTKGSVRDDSEMNEEVASTAEKFEKISGKKIMDVFESDEWSAVLTWDGVREAHARGVTIGSHTVNHVRIGAVDEDEARKELLESKQMIETQTGVECLHFCYPNGSCEGRSPSLVKEAGFKSAVIEQEGSNTIGSDPMLLNRIAFPMSETETDVELLAHVSGLAQAVYTLKERVRRLR